MTPEERGRLIERYREGPAAVRAVVAEVGEARLDAQEEPGEWTPRQIVHHLADSEMTSAIRLRRLLVEDSPTIHGYDEAAFARQLHYEVRPVEAALAALDAARATSAELLERLTEADWSRAGTHTEDGPYSVETWLENYADHAHDHADQIGRAAGIP